jgi:hypothetical protein
MSRWCACQSATSDVPKRLHVCKRNRRAGRLQTVRKPQTVNKIEGQCNLPRMVPKGRSHWHPMQCLSRTCNQCSLTVTQLALSVCLYCPSHRATFLLMCCRHRFLHVRQPHGTLHLSNSLHLLWRIVLFTCYSWCRQTLPVGAQESAFATGAGPGPVSRTDARATVRKCCKSTSSIMQSWTFLASALRTWPAI